MYWSSVWAGKCVPSIQQRTPGVRCGLLVIRHHSWPAVLQTPHLHHLAWWSVQSVFNCCLISTLYLSIPGIRSLNFHHDLLTIGTGNGFIHFYDIRMKKLLGFQSNGGSSLAMGDCWVRFHLPIPLNDQLSFYSIHQTMNALQTILNWMPFTRILSTHPARACLLRVVLSRLDCGETTLHCGNSRPSHQLFHT
jgi:hypothetical protein